jgi:hypothetical protein
MLPTCIGTEYTFPFPKAEKEQQKKIRPKKHKNSSWKTVNQIVLCLASGGCGAMTLVPKDFGRLTSTAPPFVAHRASFLGWYHCCL